MNALLVYPKYPNEFWSWNHIMRIIDRKAAFPPLGLLTVAAMMPAIWSKKLVDMNVSELTDGAILWADCVFISAMAAQRNSVKEVIARCNKLGVKVIAGGPLFTISHEEFSGVDHFLLGEAEGLIDQLSNDLFLGRAKSVYASAIRPNLRETPIPLWELIDPKKYVSLSVQHSRGCPFDCEFCDITVMDGRVPRIKPVDQFIKEIQAVYETGFRGMVLVVDDNFIGNKKMVKQMLLELIVWQKSHGYPFAFSTEASVNLADDEELMELMVTAGFNQVFLGLETPSDAGLKECGKSQNRRDLVATVKKIQRHGLHVLGGFIVGFDSDPATIFEDQIKFIQAAGVVVAMVGLLQAIPKTRLHKRLAAEGRLLDTDPSGEHTDYVLNFKPVMDKNVLRSGYKEVLRTIYSPKKYYERMCTFLDEYNSRGHRNKRTDWGSLKAFARSIWYIGLTGSWVDRWYYWKMLFVAFFKYRRAYPEAVAMLIYGDHLRKVANSTLKS